MEDTIKNAKKATADLEDNLKWLKETVATLTTVADAASKTETELLKSAKGKTGDDKEKYTKAASVAATFGAKAGRYAKEMK